MRHIEQHRNSVNRRRRERRPRSPMPQMNFPDEQSRARSDEPSWADRFHPAAVCTTLPQPRSRMAFAAETRAAGVASFDCMMPASTLMAVRVWLRARDRTSVNVLDLLKCVPHGDRHKTEQRKRDQIRRHRPLHRKRLRHDRCAQSFPGTNRYPSTKRGRGRRWRHATPHADTFARAGKTRLSQSSDLERLGRRRADDAQARCMGGCGVVPCGCRPIQECRFQKDNEKARGGFLRAGLSMIAAMMTLCH